MMANKWKLANIEADSLPVIRDDANIKDDEQCITVKLAVPVKEPELQPTIEEQDVKNDDMKHRITQGYALIIHNDTFPSRANPKRSGSEKDLDAIKQFCVKAGLHIEQPTNLTASGINELCREMSMRDFFCYDGFICFILSHGDEQGIYGVDDNVISIQKIVTRFQMNTSLAGKPKLFFIQSCRGPSPDGGEHPDSCPINESFNECLPPGSDTLVVHSSIKGYLSYRSPEHGSWFIITLMEQLTKYANQMHIMDILIRVNNIIATYYTKNGRKQMPCQEMSTIRKFVYFNLHEQQEAEKLNEHVNKEIFKQHQG